MLHPELLEIGRSGQRYDKVEALRELAGRTDPAPMRAGSYALAVLGEGLALLTYETALVDEDGRATRQTLRSSLWVRTAAGWRYDFTKGHQRRGSGASAWSDVGSPRSPVESLFEVVRSVGGAVPEEDYGGLECGKIQSLKK